MSCHVTPCHAKWSRKYVTRDPTRGPTHVHDPHARTHARVSRKVCHARVSRIPVTHVTPIFYLWVNGPFGRGGVRGDDVIRTLVQSTFSSPLIGPDVEPHSIREAPRVSNSFPLFSVRGTHLLSFLRWQPTSTRMKTERTKCSWAVAPWSDSGSPMMRSWAMRPRPPNAKLSTSDSWVATLARPTQDTCGSYRNLFSSAKARASWSTSAWCVCARCKKGILSLPTVWPTPLSKGYGVPWKAS